MHPLHPQELAKPHPLIPGTPFAVFNRYQQHSRKRTSYDFARLGGLIDGWTWRLEIEDEVGVLFRMRDKRVDSWRLALKFRNINISRRTRCKSVCGIYVCVEHRIRKRFIDRCIFGFAFADVERLGTQLVVDKARVRAVVYIGHHRG